MTKREGKQFPSPAACGGYYLRAAGGKLSHGSIPCKRWDCRNPACAPGKLKYYYAIFCNGLGVKEGEESPIGEDVTLITVTTDPKKWDNKKQAWDRVGYSFKLLRQRIYLHYGKFEYVAVLESTKEGWPHIHTVCKGIAKIPQGWYEEYYDKEKKRWFRVTNQSQKKNNRYRIIKYDSPDGKPTLSQMAESSGFGFVCDVRSVEFDNAKGAANYLLGYLEKSLMSNDYPTNSRRVRYTPGWLLDDWEKPAKPNGTGLVVPTESMQRVLLEYINQGTFHGFAPEATIGILREIGPRKAANQLLKGLPLEFDAEIDYDLLSGPCLTTESAPIQTTTGD